MLARVLDILPYELQVVLQRLPSSVQDQVEEIRIREARPLEICYVGQSAFVAEDGRMDNQPKNAYLPKEELCRKLLDKITQSSMYAMEEELKRGYITTAGGHRIGLSGRTILSSGAVRNIRDISSFNIRIAREVSGAANSVLPRLLDHSGRTVHSTLVLAPPMQGKTTMLRDLARMISYGNWGSVEGYGWSGKKVAIVDERSEIAASVRGIPAFDVGPRTDVMDACPKAEGMMMMLRSMSPDVIIVDEIGSEADAQAIVEASHAGVRIIASAHAHDLADARGRPALGRLLAAGAFRKAVQLQRTSGVGMPQATIISIPQQMRQVASSWEQSGASSC